MADLITLSCSGGWHWFGSWCRDFATSPQSDWKSEVLSWS